MAIKETKVFITWGARNIKRLQELGYKYTKKGDSIEVLVEHLSPNSEVIITRICDNCSFEWSGKYCSTGNLCKKCSIKPAIDRAKWLRNNDKEYSRKYSDRMKEFNRTEKGKEAQKKATIAAAEKSMANRIDPETLLNEKIDAYIIDPQDEKIQNMLIDDFVEIVLCPNNYIRYAKLGYTLCEFGEKIQVNPKDLPRFSDTEVKIKYFCCDKIKTVKKRNVKERCNDCRLEESIKKLNSQEMRNRAREQMINYNTGKFGPKHQRYKISRTDDERKNGRNTTENYIWKKSVFKRDNGICQFCSIKINYNKGVRSRIHHLDGYSWCKEKRYELNNGITLCEKCHNQFHNIYGTYNVKEEMTLEWFSANFLHNFSSLQQILDFNKLCQQTK